MQCTLSLSRHRPHTLSLISTDAINSPLLLHSSAQKNDLKEWTDILSTSILAQNLKKIKELKDNFDLDDVSFIGCAWIVAVTVIPLLSQSAS